MKPICVIDAGAFTSIGQTSAAAAAARRAEISEFVEYGKATDRTGKPVIVSAPPGIVRDQSIENTMADLAIGSLLSMTTMADCERSSKKVGIFLSLPETRPGLPESYGSSIARTIISRLDFVRTAKPQSYGHAAGGAALAQAAEYLEANSDQYAAVVGVDTYIEPETLRWLDANRQLHTSYNAWGFVPGAAAGACLLCNPIFARQNGTHPLAIVEDVALLQEANLIKSNGVCLGRALTEAVETVLRGQPVDQLIDSLYCDLNGETYRSDELGFMLCRSSTHFRDPGDFIAPADCWGDVGAASIPLFVGLAIQAAVRGYSKGPLSLHLAGSESGLRTAVRLRTFEEKD